MRGHPLGNHRSDRQGKLDVRRLALAALTSLSATSCTRHQSPIAASPDLASRPPADSTQRYWPGKDGDGAARALGLFPLRDGPGTAGVREIRIWAGGGIGAENDLLRLVQRNGNTVGTWARYWKLGESVSRRNAPPLTIDSLVRHALAGRCGPFNRGDGIEACLVKTVTPPAWRTIWDSLAHLGVWTLPDERTLPPDNMFMADGTLLTVELRDGTYYREYQYSNPDAHPRAEHKAAAAIGRLAVSFWHTIAPGTNYHTYRGRLDVGRPFSEMIPCGSTKRWQVQWITSRQVDSIRKEIPLTDTISRHPVYAEIRGLQALRPMVPPGFDEMLEVPELTVLRPWDPARCRD